MGTIQARTHYTSGLTPCLDWTHTQGWTGLTLWAGLERRWICTNEVWTPLEVARIGYRGTGFGDQTTPGE